MNSKREIIGEKFIVIILILWLGSEVLFSSNIEYVFGTPKAVANDTMAIVILVLLLTQIFFFQKYSFRELIIILLITLFIAIATLNSDHNTMMSTWIFIVAAKTLDFSKVMKYAYIVQLLMMLMVFYLFFSGYIDEYTMYRGNTLRHSWGFTHPNLLGVRIFQLIITRCYIRRDKINLWDCGVIIAAAVFINRVANSQTSFYSLIILALISFVHFIVVKTKRNTQRMASIFILVALASNVASTFMILIDVKKYMLLSEIDRFMSSRFSQCHRTMKYYGIKLLGQKVQMYVKRPGVGRYYHFWLDNAYGSILLRYGVIVFLIFSVLYLYAMVCLKRLGQVFLLEIMCLFAIYGIMENNFYFMSQNMFLLLLSYPIYRYNLSFSREQSIVSRIKLVW